MSSGLQASTKIVTIIAIPGLLLISGRPVRGTDLCPNPTTLKSGKSHNVAWSVARQQIAEDRACTQHVVTAPSPGAALAVSWPGGGILETNIAGRFALSFCCAEKVETRRDVLLYGAPPKTQRTTVLTLETERDTEYPDLIEEDAKVYRTALAGELWDGGKYIRLQLELRAAASNPHVKQTVFEFIATDLSSEPLEVDWDVVRGLSAKTKPFYSATPKDQAYRKTTYVFFTDDRPEPTRTVVAVKTSAGKLLGRFAINAFATSNTSRLKPSPK